MQTTNRGSTVRNQGTAQLEELWDAADTRTRQQLAHQAFEEHLDSSIIRAALVRFIVQSRLPFSIVESSSFHAFIQALNPAAIDVIPASHSTIRTSIQEHWYSEKLILQREVQTAVSKINISLDIWTSPNRILFLAIVGHYVRHTNGTIAKALLALKQVAGHSGEDQFQVLRNVLVYEYEIAQKLGVIVGDNSGTNDTLCRTICQWLHDEYQIQWEPESNRIRCLGHLINLFVQAFMFSGTSSALSTEELVTADEEELQGQPPSVIRAAKMRIIGSIGKLHNVVVHIRGSGQRTKEFLDQARRMIPLDNRTRWNSWYYMILIALDLEMHVDFYIKNQPDLLEDTLTRQDWNMLRTMRTFLKQFKDLVVENEGDAKCLGHSLPSMWLIRTHMLAFKAKHERGNTDFDQDCVLRVTAAITLFEKWWAVLWKHPLYHMATILHPYYRTKFLNKVLQGLRVSKVQAEQKRKWVKQIWLNWVEDHREEELERQSSVSSQEQGNLGRRKRRTTAEIARALQDRSIEAQMERLWGDWVEEGTDDEWEIYCNEPTIKGVKDILSWWQDPVRRQQYPKLSRFAIEICSIPPMSDEPERVFSGGRRTISWQRSKLQPDIIEVVECLHHWLKHSNDRRKK